MSLCPLISLYTLLATEFAAESLPTALASLLFATYTSGVALFAFGVRGVNVTVILKFCVALGGVPLLADTVPVEIPACVGVPVISPEADNDKPFGKAPLVTLNVRGDDSAVAYMKL